MVIVYTIVSPDGVIGLNGKHYLLDDDDNLMKFPTIEDAKEFISDGGEDPENEFIDYSELDDDGNDDG